MTSLFLAATILSLTNEYAVVDFNDQGGVDRIVARASGRELVKPGAFVGVSLPYCGFLGADKTERVTQQPPTTNQQPTTTTPQPTTNNSQPTTNLLRFFLPGDRGTLTLSVKPFAGGWTFAIEKAEVPEATRYLVRLVPGFGTYFGKRANLVSDAVDGVAIKPYDLHALTACSPGNLSLSFSPDHVTGARFGLVAGDRSHLTDMLKAMTLVSGRAHSTGGGAWTRDTDAARNSYLNANVTAASLDDWIDLMERGGFGVLHFRERWYDCRGHYPVRREDWPNGLADMKTAVEKIHARGYLAGMHTLTACIDPKDPWVAGDDNRDLRARETYHLAADLAADAKELTVDAPPTCKHDIIFTYSGNGNALRIGTEIIQYTGFTTEPPYRYTGLTRGAFGTRVAAHRKGDETAYLEQRYLAFYPEPDSPLADKVADAIANVYNTCQFDQIYCDGAEAGSGTDKAYYTATMRDKIIRRCAADGRPVLNEDSCSCPNNVWWMHSRVGAWDSCSWAPKAFHDLHVETIKRQQVREADLLEIQMGWWAPFLACPHFPSHKIDDMEYYASRNAGLDASMSIACVDVSRKPLGFHQARMMTVLGWYERARRAKAFAPGVREAMDEKGAEFRLRQNPASGVWEIARVKCGLGKVTLDAAPREAIVRVEALYSGAPLDATAVPLTAGVPAASFSHETANKNVSIASTDRLDETGARIICLEAENHGTTSRGAWVRASADFRPYRSPGSSWVMRFRVKGDGSGALLNVQAHTPREFGEARSEHYIDLDFTGWREFEIPFRERSSARYTDYVWPSTDYAPIFHRLLHMNNLDAVNFYLNEIPAGGKVAVEISDIALVRQVRTTAERAAVRVNDATVKVPFALASGDFAELEGGVWTRYDEYGNPLERRTTGDCVTLRPGANVAVYGGKTAAGARTRGEVTLFAVGERKPALVDPTALEAFYRKFLAYEADDPTWFAPEKGFAGPTVVAMRPGEAAQVEFRFRGALQGGVLTFDGRSYALQDLAKDDTFRLVTKGVHSGVLSVRLKAKTADCRLEVIKRYRP